MSRMIDADALKDTIEEIDWYHVSSQGVLVHGANPALHTPLYKADDIYNALDDAPTIDVEPVKHGRTYTVHEVAEILADEYGDICACNFNGNDEWLPMKCELLDACPNPVGVACWEQFLKWRDSKEVDNG